MSVSQASEELEERESLAQIAASGENTSLSDGETYIGKSERLDRLLRNFRSNVRFPCR